MEGLEATSLLFGSFVAIITLLSSVWYAAVSVSNRNRDILFMKEDVLSIKDSIESINNTLAERIERLDRVERTLDALREEMIKMVYINSDHIIVEDHEGRAVKLPMLK